MVSWRDDGTLLYYYHTNTVLESSDSIVYVDIKAFNLRFEPHLRFSSNGIFPRGFELESIVSRTLNWALGLFGECGLVGVGWDWSG